MVIRGIPLVALLACRHHGHRQRLAALRRERAAARAPTPAVPLGEGGGERGGRVGDALPLALRRFLPRETTLPRVQREAAAAAARCCAVTLVLEAALRGWLRQQQAVAAPPASFDAGRLLYGSAPAQMGAKLDAVRHCAAAAGLHTAEATAGVARWLLRALPESVAVPCGLVQDDEPARYRLPDGTGLQAVSEVVDEKLTIWDGQVLTPGEIDGEFSGASYEPGPWRWGAAEPDPNPSPHNPSPHPRPNSSPSPNPNQVGRGRARVAARPLPARRARAGAVRPLPP